MPILQHPDSLLTTVYVKRAFNLSLNKAKKKNSFNEIVFLLFNKNAVHGNDLSGNRGEIASPLYPHPYIHRDDFSWRVTVDNERFVRLYFYPQFSLEREHDSTTCISSVLVWSNQLKLLFKLNLKINYYYDCRFTMDMMSKPPCWENTVGKFDLDRDT